MTKGLRTTVYAAAALTLAALLVLLLMPAQARQISIMHPPFIVLLV